jgi:hypothetical protein
MSFLILLSALANASTTIATCSTNAAHPVGILSVAIIPQRHLQGRLTLEGVFSVGDKTIFLELVKGDDSEFFSATVEQITCGPVNLINLF